MSVVDGSKPDLVFYYSLALPSTIINPTIQGSDVIQTANGILFADPEFLKPFGKFAFNVTIFNGAEQRVTKLLYEVTGTNVFFLPEGSISNSINLLFTKNQLGRFIVPPESTNVFQILSGSKDFLNQRGFIFQRTYNLLSREIQVYFEKSEVK